MCPQQWEILFSKSNVFFDFHINIYILCESTVHVNELIVCHKLTALINQHLYVRKMLRVWSSEL